MIDPSPKDVLLMVFAGSSGLDIEDIEQDYFMMSLIENIEAALTFFGWLRWLPSV